MPDNVERDAACDVGIPACGGPVVGAILVAGTRVNSAMPLDEDTGGVVLMCAEHYTAPATWPQATSSGSTEGGEQA